MAHTNKYVVYEFWRSIMTDASRVAEIVDHFVPIENKRMFEVYQDKYAHYRDPYVRAAIFFVLNQCSDGNLVSSGNLQKSSPDPLCLTYLKNFVANNFHMKFDKEEDIVESFKNINEEEYILIPAGRYSMNLFEEGKSFGLEETKIYHKKIKDFFDTTNKKVVLLYHWSPQVHEWYKGYDLKMYNKWGVHTLNQEDCSEVVIANF